jgi:hypothetical protein
MRGSLKVLVPAVSTLVLRADLQLPIRRPTVSIRVADDDLSGLVRATATVARGGPASVAFALRRPGRTWERIAVDDSPPYRAFLERSTDGDLVAVARALDGAVAVSPVVTRKGRPANSLG